MKKKILIISVCLLLILSLSVGVYWHYHPTHFLYNDRFILGNTKENIVERYGEFSKTWENENGKTVYGNYMIRDNTPEMVMSYDNSLWYEIYFENEIAVKIKLQEGWYGG